MWDNNGALLTSQIIVIIIRVTDIVVHLCERSIDLLHLWPVAVRMLQSVPGHKNEVHTACQRENKSQPADSVRPATVSTVILILENCHIDNQSKKQPENYEKESPVVHNTLLLHTSNTKVFM